MIENFIKNIFDIDNKIDFNYPFIIFDIGSRDCIQSIEFYKLFPNAKIYAFECNPNTIDICKQNIKNYDDRIILIDSAITDYDGEISFYPIDQNKTITSWKDGNPGASSIFKNNGTYIYEKYFQYEISVSCYRLDTIMKKYNIPIVDIIWMDLQGAELLALKGLGKYLEKVKYIHTEVSHKELYFGQVMYDELNNFITSNNFILKNKLSMSGWQEDAIYYKAIDEKNDSQSKEMFDIVICLGAKDKDIINEQIKYTKKNVIGYRNIYIISYDPHLNIEGCITINENIFPFSMKTVNNFHGVPNRNGWYLQQLFKLYSGLIIPDILDKYLVIDSDTFFIKPVKFIENDKCLYNYGFEYNFPYFSHMKCLDSNFTKVFQDKSGICHHMIFETKYIKELFKIVETNHNDLFYNVFLKSVNLNYTSGASEYEIYFNYIFKYHTDSVKIRKLKWINTDILDTNSDNDYISYHWWMRKQ